MAPVKVVVTGAAGLIGRHAAIRLHARNCAARFAGKPEPIDLVRLDHAAFADAGRLRAAVRGADAVLHLAGVNRAPEAEVKAANPAIAEALVAACRAEGARPHVSYANSIHADGDTIYGRSKARAAEILAAAGPLADLVLPHVFGEVARPRYNNVTATFVEHALQGTAPEVNPEGRVRLVHAGAVAEAMIEAALKRRTGRLPLPGTEIGVPALWERIRGFHESYAANVFPDLSDPFDAALFNSYRAATYPRGWPRPLTLRTDARGTLFEAVKGGGGGQTFLSTTLPGVTRGDHFHLAKVERFLVVEGEAIIRVRPALSDEVWSYRVSGETPAPVDMPTLCTHSIENVGDRPLLTLFWTNEIFDPARPDTYADPVLPCAA